MSSKLNTFKPLLGFALLATVLVAGLWASGISIHDLHDRVSEMGPLGPVVWSICLILLLPFMAPVSILTILSGLAFGPLVGFFSAYVGVVVGGWLSFFVSRMAGRGFVERLLGDQVGKLEPHLDQHGLFGILYLRMLPFPFVPISYLAGMTRIAFVPFAVGTAIGIIPGVLVNTLVAGTVGEVWLEDQSLSALFTPKTWWAGAIVVVSILLPFVIEWVRRLRRGATGAAVITEEHPEVSGEHP